MNVWFVGVLWWGLTSVLLLWGGGCPAHSVRPAPQTPTHKRIPNNKQHIETVVGQAAGHAGGELDPVDETRFVLQQAAAEGREARIRIVAFAKLSQLPEAEAVLSAHRAVAGDKLVGVRMILNHAAGGPPAPGGGGGEDDSLTWPQVERGDFLTGGVPSFKEGFALLAKHGLSFDLQCNWFQLADAAAFLAGFPETAVVLDHLGCPKLTGTDEAEDARRVAEWRRGMGALAALPNVHVKLSMLECVGLSGLGSVGWIGGSWVWAYAFVFWF